MHGKTLVTFDKQAISFYFKILIVDLFQVVLYITDIVTNLIVDAV